MSDKIGIYNCYQSIPFIIDNARFFRSVIDIGCGEREIYQLLLTQEQNCYRTFVCVYQGIDPKLGTRAPEDIPDKHFDIAIFAHVLEHMSEEEIVKTASKLKATWILTAIPLKHFSSCYQLWDFEEIKEFTNWKLDKDESTEYMMHGVWKT